MRKKTNGARKNTNGEQDAAINVARFLAWERDVTDFRKFMHQGALSKSKVGREAGLTRGVWYSNDEIRDKLWPALVRRVEQEGVLRQRETDPADRKRQRRSSGVSDARIKQIQDENEALKAENKELRRRLEKLEGMDEILRTTGRLPW